MTDLKLLNGITLEFGFKIFLKTKNDWGILHYIKNCLNTIIIKIKQNQLNHLQQL